MYIYIYICTGFFLLAGMERESPPPAKNLLISPKLEIFSSSRLHAPPPPPPLTKQQFSSYNPIKTAFLAVVIALAPSIFVLISFSLDTQVMLIFILIDVQYSQEAVFSFEKGSNR